MALVDGDKLVHIECLKSELNNVDIVNGQLIYLTDAQEVYQDVDGQRKQIQEIINLENIDLVDLPLAPLQNKYYLWKQDGFEKCLYFSNGTNYSKVASVMTKYNAPIYISSYNNANYRTTKQNNMGIPKEFTNRVDNNLPGIIDLEKGTAPFFVAPMQGLWYSDDTNEFFYSANGAYDFTLINNKSRWSYAKSLSNIIMYDWWKCWEDFWNNSIPYTQISPTIGRWEIIGMQPTQSGQEYTAIQENYDGKGHTLYAVEKFDNLTNCPVGCYTLECTNSTYFEILCPNTLSNSNVTNFINSKINVYQRPPLFCRVLRINKTNKNSKYEYPFSVAQNSNVIFQLKNFDFDLTNTTWTDSQLRTRVNNWNFSNFCNAWGFTTTNLSTLPSFGGAV